MERQLAQFEELESLAKNAAAALDDGMKKFVDTSSYARKNLSVGSLPPEAEDEDTKLLDDLKGFDEALDQKQEQEHQAAMDELRERQSNLSTQIEEVQTEINHLNASTSKEKKKQERIAEDIDALKKQHESADKELIRLQQLNPKEDQEKLDKTLQENNELLERIEASRRDLFMAQKRVSLHNEAFEQAKNLAKKLLVAGGKLKWQEEEGGTKKEGKSEEGEAVVPESPKALVGDSAAIDVEAALDGEASPSGDLPKIADMRAGSAPGEDTAVDDEALGEEGKSAAAATADVEATSLDQEPFSPASDQEPWSPATATIWPSEPGSGTESPASPTSPTTPWGQEEPESPTSPTSPADGTVEGDVTSPRGFKGLGTVLAMKKGAQSWMKNSLGKQHTSPKLPPEIQKHLDEEQRDADLAEQIQCKCADLNREIAHIESWVQKSKDVEFKEMLELQEQKVESEVPPQVLELRQQVKKRKKLLQNLRTNWSTVRELAKRGARGQQKAGKESGDLRLAILNLCEEALADAGCSPDQAKTAVIDDAVEPSATDDGVEPVDGNTAATDDAGEASRIG